MTMRASLASAVLMGSILATSVRGVQAGPASPPQAADAPATRPAGFPEIEIDRERRQVRVAAERIDVTMPLEFFAVRAGGPEHEAIFRTRALPSHVHAALLILGLEAGSPVRYSEATQSWIAPHGPPLQIRVAWEQDGRAVEVPAYRLMRHLQTKREMPPQTWIFAGSRVMEDGSYAADATGYVVTIVNFDFALIDVPQIASSENAKLLWELNDAVAPPAGTKVTMILEPIASGDPGTRPATERDAAGGTIDLDALRKRWESAVAPHAQNLKAASQTHYEVIGELRRQQQRLIDEADRVQRLIDELDRQYQQMTTPRPSPPEPR